MLWDQRKYRKKRYRQRWSRATWVEGNQLVTPGKRGTAHDKRYELTWQVWVWFVFLCMKQHKRHPEPFNKTERGRKRRNERRWKEQQRWERSP